MGESDMKMDEPQQQPAVEATPVRIEDEKKNDTLVVAVVAVDSEKLPDEVVAAAEEEVDETSTDVNGEVINDNEDELMSESAIQDLHNAEPEQQHEPDVVEEEIEHEVTDHVDEQQHAESEPQPTGGEEDAGDDESLTGADFKNAIEDEAMDDAQSERKSEKNESDHEDDAHNANELSEQHEDGDDVNIKTDVGDEDVEGEGEVEDAIEELQPPDSLDNKHSILENALKNGTTESPENLNKMHMEDVREGCDSAQPSSPGHAEQRSELASETTSVCDDGSLHMQDAYMTNSIKVEINSDDDKSPKRKNIDDDDADEPAKKLKKDMQQENYLRNKILNEYTDALDASNYDQLQNEEDKLIVEIHNLNDHAKEKERQWNNIIHMKKMKEELLMRIQRQKQVCMLSNGMDTSDSETTVQHCETTSNGGHRSLLQQRHRQQNAQKGSQPNLEMNGHDANKARNNKGPVLRNVQSIIDDYRQRHPEIVPRRGRRRRNMNGSLNEASPTNGRLMFPTSGGTVTYNPNANNNNGGGSARSVDGNSEIALLLSSMENASHDVQNETESSIYKDFLEQIAHSERKKSSMLMKQQASPVPAQFPEVTVHAVTNASTPNAPTNSLLHGILTKTQVKTDSRTTFSPTLARLLTAPDKSHGAQPNKSSNVSISDILSTNKSRSEITITPVASDYEDNHSKRKHHMEDETEDSVDRLVIDESTDLGDSRTGGDNNSDAGDEVPQCQGCNQKAAQFVCAGCGNQWYCSRECQVNAWDEHSDVCSG